MSEFSQEMLNKHKVVPIIIEIDSREAELNILLLQKVLLSEFNGLVKIVSRQLPLGDIIIYKFDIATNTKTELVMFERKTPADLAASIRDGRYNEQSHRLSACTVHNHNILYIIEGDVLSYRPPYKRISANNIGNSKRSPINTSSLVSAMMSLQFYKGFSVVNVSDMSKTCDYILGAARKFGKEIAHNRQVFYSNDTRYTRSPTDVSVRQEPNTQISTHLPLQQSYSDVHSNRVKKNNITTDNIGEIMLSQIPSVSTSIAKIIIGEYSTVEQLICSIRKDPDCLSKLTRTNRTGKVVKISSASIANIKRFLISDKTQASAVICE